MILLGCYCLTFNYTYFSSGRQSRADREKDRHRTLIGATSGHHSPSPRDQFVHDQQQFLNAATSSGAQKASGRPRSPSGNTIINEPMHRNNFVAHLNISGVITIDMFYNIFEF